MVLVLVLTFSNLHRWCFPYNWCKYSTCTREFCTVVVVVVNVCAVLLYTTNILQAGRCTVNTDAELEYVNTDAELEYVNTDAELDYILW